MNVLTNSNGSGVEMHTLAFGNPAWLPYCLPTLTDYASRCGYRFTVWEGSDVGLLATPKFILVRILREFLEGPSNVCLWVDADVMIRKDAPPIPVSEIPGWMLAEDPNSGDFCGRWVRWCRDHHLPAFPGWRYRNSGVWMCNRVGAAELLRMVKKPYIVGVMDQHQLNYWLSRLPSSLVGMLGTEWNLSAKITPYGSAWFTHLMGKDKVKFAEITAKVFKGYEDAN